MRPIYLDYNATTPLHPAVAEAMRPFLAEGFGNPSSGHRYGVEARAAVEEARRQVAAAIGALPEEILFTSGGTEANNAAVKGLVFARRERGDHIVISAVEHPSVSEACAWLSRHGFRVTRVGVDATGLTDPGDVERALTPATILVSVMHANNEVGTLQPVAEIGAIVRSRGIAMHTDAAQSLGKVPVNVDALGVDLLSIAGHKLYAPKGVGALYIRTGTALDKFLHGADHERNRRAGTENVLEIVGLGKACALAAAELAERAAHMKELRDRLHAGLLSRVPDLRLNGHPEKRLPNTLSVSFPGIEANAILHELAEEVAASAGAACHTDRVELSATLRAMGVPPEVAMGTVRFSTGRLTTAEEVDRAVEIVASVVERLRPSGSAPGVSTAGAGGEVVKLTRFTTGLGCACKMRPQDLEVVLRSLPVRPDPNALVGPETSDDAAVWRVSDDLALVQTVDFFTPVVDDPYWFGAISAANSLSDIYAMGARPAFALSIVAFPSKRLPLAVLERILRGAADVAAEAGISILGGHTIEDNEPKFGLAVTGLVHPGKVLTNRAARPGDALLLTKPLGTGVLTTALKRGMLDAAAERRLHEAMAALNARAASAVSRFPAHAATDVTGFGLLGHLREMAAASGADAEIEWRSVPLLEGAREAVAAGAVPGGTLNNLDFVTPHVEFAADVPESARILLADAQTSGGLLVALPADSADALVAALREGGVPAACRIGRFAAPGPGRVRVV